MNDITRFQIVGIGNVDREDDGVGHAVAERLSRLHPDWNIRTVRQLLPEMVYSMRNCNRIIFIDGAVDLLPGFVVVDQVATATTTLISHQLAPAEFMKLVELIGTDSTPLPEPIDAWVVKIGVCRLGFGRQLSPDVHASLQMAVEAIEKIVSTWNINRANKLLLPAS